MFNHSTILRLLRTYCRHLVLYLASTFFLAKKVLGCGNCRRVKTTTFKKNTSDFLHCEISMKRSMYVREK